MHWRSCGENVSSSTLVLNVRIRVPLDNLLNVKACLMEVGCHLVRTKKEKVHADLLSPPLLQMNAVVADMESEQQDPTWSQHSPEFAQRLCQVATRDVDNRIKGYDACPRSVGCIQRQHVALAKLHPRSQVARSLHHPR